MAQKKQFGEFLVDTGRLSRAQLEDALRYRKQHNIYLGKAVIQLGFIAEEDMSKALSEFLKVPYLKLGRYNIDNSVLEHIPETMAKHYNILPIFALDNSLTVATNDPLDVEMIDDVSHSTGMDVNLVISSESDIERSIDLYYNAEKYKAQTENDQGQLVGPRVISQEIGEDQTAIEAVDLLFEEAVRIGASDIHIEPRQQDVRVRFRVDGVLQEYYTLPKASIAPVISRVKVLSGMDISESRRPQDGRFHLDLAETDVDVRSSSYPTTSGEKMVMRILDSSKGNIDLHKLGFAPRTLELWRRLITMPNGVVLVSGPTGSGKTTTLYATLNAINSVETNIVTIEDPVEYQLPDINQAQVNVKAGVTFAAALRSILRQDPDVIMVGEIRDRDTADLAVRSALTGHLVLSTIHTNDAAAGFSRILDMGIDSYLVASTVRGILAQRLVRRLCPRCKLPQKPDKALFDALKFTGKAGDAFFGAVGCLHCKNTGYFGREAVYELLIPDETIMAMINEHRTASEIKRAAVEKGMETLADAALYKAKKGLTSLDEVLKVSASMV